MHMKTLMRKTKPAAVIEPQADSIETLTERLDSLRARDRVLLRQIMDSAKVSQEAADPPSHKEILAQRLAEGDPDKTAPTESAELLLTWRQEREAIERATALIEAKLIPLYAARAKETFERRGQEWRELIRDTALTVCKLQRLNRQREQLSREIRGRAGPMLALPAAHSDQRFLCGYGSAADGDAYNFLAAVLKAGYVTAAEIARERGDTRERLQ